MARTDRDADSNSRGGRVVRPRARGSSARILAALSVVGLLGVDGDAAGDVTVRRLMVSKKDLVKDQVRDPIRAIVRLLAGLVPRMSNCVLDTRDVERGLTEPSAFDVDALQLTRRQIDGRWHIRRGKRRALAHRTHPATMTERPGAPLFALDLGEGGDVLVNLRLGERRPRARQEHDHDGDSEN